ncbi:MAG: AmmeMemoRadiSam system protein B [bacterium]|nr:AmmeMemoRadiSam system protein B [bacterium]
MIREPAVAGHFYPGNSQVLRKDVENYLQTEAPPEPALGIVSPHAGYRYSGHVAGAVFSKVKIPNQAIVLCPNHTGMGAFAAINSSGAWETPLGNMDIEESLAKKLMELNPSIEEDDMAHAREHALEVQIPFLQVLNPQCKMVPLCLSHFPYGECERMGQALAQLIKDASEEILLVASSDMNHYENQERTLKKDQMAIDRILALDPAGLYETVHEESISMCGIIPTTCMLIAALALGASEATLVKHATSGDVSGDYAGVVGYAGIIVR